MATFYTVIGSVPTGMSANRMREEADRVVSGERHILDWSRSANLLYRFTYPSGRLPVLLSDRIGVNPDMALTCRAYKDAGQKGIHVDLAGLLGLFGDNTALLRSDGAVLALTRNGLVGVSDFPEYGDDIDGWVSVASGVFANRARFLNQAELSQALMEET